MATKHQISRIAQEIDADVQFMGNGCYGPDGIRIRKNTRRHWRRIIEKILSENPPKAPKKKIRYFAYSINPKTSSFLEFKDGKGTWHLTDNTTETSSFDIDTILGFCKNGTLMEVDKPPFNINNDKKQVDLKP